MSRKTVDGWTNDDGEKEHEPCLTARQIKLQKRKEAEERNKAYRSRFSSLEDELEYCLKHGGREKQVLKLRKKIDERNKRQESQVVASRPNKSQNRRKGKKKRK